MAEWLAGSLSRSYGSGAGSYGTRGAAIAEDEELGLEQDAALLLLLGSHGSRRGAAAHPALPRGISSAASLDDDEADDGAAFCLLLSIVSHPDARLAAAVDGDVEEEDALASMGMEAPTEGMAHAADGLANQIRATFSVPLGLARS